MRFIIVFNLILFVAACSSVPLTSIPKLSRINPQTTEVSQLRAIIKYPSVVKILGTKATYSIEVNAEGETRKKDAEFVRGSASDVDIRQANRVKEEGYKVEIFKISPSDIADLKAIQNWVTELKKQGKSGSAGFSISVGKICLLEETDNPLLLNIWVNTSETGGYVQSLRNADMREYSQQNSDVGLELCK